MVHGRDRAAVRAAIDARDRARRAGALPARGAVQPCGASSSRARATSAHRRRRPTMPAPDARTDVIAPDRVDARLIDRLHGDLPLTERPFADVGRELGIARGRGDRAAAPPAGARRADALRPAVPDRARRRAVRARRDARCPRRDFDARRRASSTRCPRWRTTTGASTALNMWFVVAAESPRSGATPRCARIEARDRPAGASPSRRSASTSSSCACRAGA